MYPFIHLVLSLFFSILFYKIYGIGIIYIWLGGFIFDIDHTFVYWKETKKYSLNFFEIYNFFDGHKLNIQNRNILFPFHVIEFLIFLFLLGLLNRIFFLISIGLLFHLILDAFQEMRLFGRLIKHPSFIVWLFKKNVFVKRLFK